MLIRIVLGCMTLLYPLAVYFGLQAFDARSLVILLVALAGIRLLTLDRSPLNHWLWLPAIALLGLWSWATNSAVGLKFYPVMINASLLLLFLWSLKFPPSMIERFARISDPQLSDQGIRYTRRVTQVWCVFFLLNGLCALLTTLFGSTEVWALYNGLIAYIAMGALFAGEWLVRQSILKSPQGEARHE
ncbi:hypothetical protein G8770_05050 [Aestuariicella hydrocarbonica]|uniref:DNA gyrase subunit B n=2 Tax=Pseudomaricurvus hydrocarbonicus TaxID=1470433 RepID=A0A9E5JT00_9GAMM|nr:hypothetical protein [Aestuariicella hydrocarbonica]